MSKKYDNDFEEDYFSPTSWDRNPDETDEDYEERMEDQEGFFDD